MLPSSVKVLTCVQIMELNNYVRYIMDEIMVQIVDRARVGQMGSIQLCAGAVLHKPGAGGLRAG